MNNVCTVQKLIAEPVAEMGFESRTERLQEQDCNVWGRGGWSRHWGRGQESQERVTTEFGTTESFTIWLNRYENNKYQSHNKENVVHIITEMQYLGLQRRERLLPAMIIKESFWGKKVKI